MKLDENKLKWFKGEAFKGGIPEMLEEEKKFANRKKHSSSRLIVGNLTQCNECLNNKNAETLINDLLSLRNAFSDVSRNVQAPSFHSHSKLATLISSASAL